MNQGQSSAYPPLDEIRLSLRPRWYRCPIDADRLRALSKRSDKQGWIQAGGHLFLFVVLAVFCTVFWVQELWWAFLPSLWCLGFVASFFSGTAPHELGHGTVFKTRRLNKAFLYTFSLISFWDPFDYASSHTYHHRYTTHPQGDRENVLPVQPSLHPWLLLQLFSVSLFSKPGRNFGKGGFFWTIYLTTRTAFKLPPKHLDVPSQEWLKVLHADQPEAFLQSVQWSRVLLVFHGVVLLLASATGLWVLPLIFTLSSFIARCGSYFTGTTQHCGLRENVTDFRKNTRSIKLNPLLSFLYWHMNWHTEHHMYANVPCYNLKVLAHEIQDDMPQPRTLIGAWIEMRNIWRRQQAEPGYQFDTPIPAAAASTVAVIDERLASSIGDLAPKGLNDV